MSKAEAIERNRDRSRRRNGWKKHVDMTGSWVDGRTQRAADWICSARAQASKAAKNRGIEWAIDSQFLRVQWEKQQGRCFYTGIPMSLDVKTFRGMRKPSIDRVDSGVGYVAGNVVFCLTAINYLKNDYGAEEVIELLHELVELHR
jgi:hypothetical protein